MIPIEFFTYTDEQWGQIRKQVLDDLGVDVDQIERQITSVIRSGGFETSITGMQPLRHRIETAASMYHFHSSVSRGSPRREELIALRKDAENLRASIIDALALQVDAKYGVVVPMLLNGIDADMLTATRDYFRKLKRNLDRQTKQAGTARDNARKPDRDRFWNELLAIWCELGGKTSGKPAASFLVVASKPVMRSAVPGITSVMRWLERRQNKTTDNPVLRRATR